MVPSAQDLMGVTGTVMVPSVQDLVGVTGTVVVPAVQDLVGVTGGAGAWHLRTVPGTAGVSVVTAGLCDQCSVCHPHLASQ